MDSILTSIKKLLGIEEEDTSFDGDVIIHINSVMTSLNQLGVGPETGFLITGKDEKWSDLLGGRKDLGMVTSYVYMKVRLIFDPPTVASVIDAYNREIEKNEWRIAEQANKEVL
jgi:hypothetical protein